MSITTMEPDYPIPPKCAAHKANHDTCDYYFYDIYALYY